MSYKKIQLYKCDVLFNIFEMFNESSSQKSYLNCKSCQFFNKVRKKLFKYNNNHVFSLFIS